MSEQLAFTLTGLAPHQVGDLDAVAHELWRAQQEALDQVRRETQTATPCACERPWPEGRTHCTKCGKEIAR